MRLKVASLPKEYQKLFKADVRGLPSNLRSPWFDLQEEKRDRRDFMCNVVGSAYGSSDNVFDQIILEDVKKYLREPYYEGGLNFTFDDEDIDVEFDSYSGNKNLKWFVELVNGKPDQKHNYVIGADISWGKGSSNSVAQIYDVNTREQAGELADSNLKPEQFADTVIALIKWVGGVVEPFLIWESNGGQGNSFCDRILWHGYSNVYMQRREDSKTRKQMDKYGWHSYTDAKEWLLSELNIALAEGLKKEPTYNSVRIYSLELYDELVEYIFAETGSEIFTSSTADMSSGARKRHGDRVIAMALCILGAGEQPKGSYIEKRNPPFGSFEYHRRQLEKQQAEEYQTKKKYLF